MTQTLWYTDGRDSGINEYSTSIQSRFERFDRENPQVYAKFKEYAGRLLCTGRHRFGAKLIIERIRWDYAIETNARDFKINNDFPSRYARKLIAEKSEFQGKFELRRIR